MSLGHVPDVIVENESKKEMDPHRLQAPTEHARHRRRTAGQIPRFMLSRLLRSVMELLGACWCFEWPPLRINPLRQTLHTRRDVALAGSTWRPVGCIGPQLSGEKDGPIH